jgi:AcrR family transcriptional regulator
MNDTRDRILDVSLDLFIERGYEKVSLREIAEQIGVTKAALYYHFSSKEEIFRTLLQPIFSMSQPVLGMLGMLEAEPTREAWARGSAALLDWILPRRKLIELMQNNHGALHALGSELHEEHAHLALHERLDAILSSDKIPLADRLRMAGSLGVVAAILTFPGEGSFARVPTEELKPLLLDAISDLLQVG